MNDDLHVENALIVLLQQIRSVAAQTATDRERFRILFPLSRDVLHWLDRLPPEARQHVVTQMDSYARRSNSSDTTFSLTPEEAICFAQLFALVQDPPPIV